MKCKLSVAVTASTDCRSETRPISWYVKTESEPMGDANSHDPPERYSYAKKN
jgi:hypothetical protein